MASNLLGLDMDRKDITFDQVFKIWFDSEIEQLENRVLLPVAKARGFNSIVEWRLTTAIRLGMDTKQWSLQKIDNPEDFFTKYYCWSISRLVKIV